MSNKIALTSSMRSNLLSLKNTQKLFDSTQDKLSTGYKVNSAMDNPSSYFTAQSLNSRADDLNTLLDSIGQAVSTLQVADQGITSLQDLVSQAKSIANSARDTANVSASVKSTIKFDTENLKSQKVAGDAIKNAIGGNATTQGDKMTIRVGDSTSLTGKTNVQDDTLLTGIGMANANGTTITDAGSLIVDGKVYKLSTNESSNSMDTVAEYDTGATFKITNIDTTAGTYTVEDADGLSVTVTGTIDATTGDSHAAAVGDTVTGISKITATVSEDGKTTYSATGTAKLTEDASHNYVKATDLSVPKSSSTTIKIQAGATVGDFANVVENMIGTNKISVSVNDSNLTIKTLDTTSIEVKNQLDTNGNDSGVGIAAALQMDAGQTVELSEDDTAESLRQKINNLEGVNAEIGTDGKMVIKSAEGDDLVISGSLAEKLGVSGAATNGNNERAQYAKQFDEVLTQIDQLVTDTSYKGINLLKGDNLTVVFNESRTSTLELKGVTFDSTGLGLTASKGDWKITADIDESLDQITKATSMLRAQASNFGQNLSTVQIRQDFTENMINELQTGADKLTLADNNEEAANMLALQTRQSLATKSLSLANQSAQGVLQLF
ncbi:MAG: hypothetical protein MJ247_07015 [Alphaproteobacteria bacterium]|nr:hypothetical protein [Alphaproteobacteria bacterium]